MNGESIQAYEARLVGCQVHIRDWGDRLAQVHDENLRLQLAMSLAMQQQYIKTTPTPAVLCKIALPVAYQVGMNLPLEFTSFQATRFAGDACFYLDTPGRPDSMAWTKLPNFDLVTKLPVNECDDPKSLSILAIDVTYSLVDQIVKNLLDSAIYQAKIYHIPDHLTDGDSVINAIQCCSNDLKDRIGRSATFAIMPPACVRLIRNRLVGFVNFDDMPLQIRRAGMLDNRITVFVNSRHTSGILLGYRGPHPADAPMVYCSSLAVNSPLVVDDKIAFHHAHSIRINQSRWLSYIPCENVVARSPAIWEF